MARPRSPDPRDRPLRDPPRDAPDVLFGVHPAGEALRARRRTVQRLLLRGAERTPRPELVRLVERAHAAGVVVVTLPPDEFDRRLPPRALHQGVALEAGPLPDVPLEALLDPPGDRWLVALDGIEDPQNLGAIARVAEAAGAHGAILPDRRAAPLSAAAVRASAGALEHLPVASVPNLTRALEAAKARGYWVHAADPVEGEDLYALPDRLLAGRLVLVLGAEGRGVRPGVRRAVDVFVRIPLRGAVASLNVATAGAVVLFEWGRRARLRARSAGGDPA